MACTVATEGTEGYIHQLQSCNSQFLKCVVEKGEFRMISSIVKVSKCIVVNAEHRQPIKALMDDKARCKIGEGFLVRHNMHC